MPWFFSSSEPNPQTEAEAQKIADKTGKPVKVNQAGKTKTVQPKKTK